MNTAAPAHDPSMIHLLGLECYMHHDVMESRKEPKERCHATTYSPQIQR